MLESRLGCPWLVNGELLRHSDASAPEVSLPAASGLTLANMIVDDVAGLVFGILGTLAGAVLLTDFRGIATAHVRGSIRSGERFCKYRRGAGCQPSPTLGRFASSCLSNAS